jgi:hypothetical protein
MCWATGKLAGTVHYVASTYLGYFPSTSEMCLIGLRIGHEGHSCRKGNVLLPGPIPHVFCGEVTIHDECPDELVPS